jgi:hypothetical protein
MEQPARSYESSFDPRIDTSEWRSAQRARLMAFARELEAEHGPPDPQLVAEVQAKIDSLDP